MYSNTQHDILKEGDVMKKSIKVFIVFVFLFGIGFFAADHNVLAPIHEMWHFIIARITGSYSRIVSWNSTTVGKSNYAITIAGFYGELFTFIILSLLFNYKNKYKLMAFFMGSAHNSLLFAMTSTDFSKIRTGYGWTDTIWVMVAFFLLVACWLLNLVIRLEKKSREKRVIIKKSTKRLTTQRKRYSFK